MTEDIAIDLPLIGADVSEAAGRQPSGLCEICSEERAGFQIGIGDYLESRCARCGAATPVPADNRPAECVRCQAGGQLGREITEAHQSRQSASPGTPEP